MVDSTDSSASELLAAEIEQWEGKKEVAVWKVDIIAWSLWAIKTGYNKDSPPPTWCANL